jgi:hypothetical protein
VIRAIEVDELKSYPLGVEILGSVESDRHGNLTDWIGLLAQHDAMEGAVGCFDHQFRKFHPVEGVIVEDVDGAAAIH